MASTPTSALAARILSFPMGLRMRPNFVLTAFEEVLGIFLDSVLTEVDWCVCCQWAERLMEGGGNEQWGDKWEERFKHGAGSKQVPSRHFTALPYIAVNAIYPSALHQCFFIAQSCLRAYVRDTSEQTTRLDVETMCIWSAAPGGWQGLNVWLMGRCPIVTAALPVCYVCHVWCARRVRHGASQRVGSSTSDGGERIILATAGCASTATAAQGSTGMCRSRWTPTTTQSPTSPTRWPWITPPRSKMFPRCRAAATSLALALMTSDLYRSIEGLSACMPQVTSISF